MSDRDSDRTASLDVSRPLEPVIEPNGAEYLVTINGSVFLALTLAEAERIAHRMRGVPRVYG